jgi:molybdopterin molybdotransferase
MADLVSVEEAQHAVLERVRPLASERIAVEHAAARVLAEPARAAVDLPPFRSSAMDGFALRADETRAAPVALPVVARIAAGRPARRALERGEAMAIATGGVVPEGADAVVPVELVVDEGDAVTVREPVSAGANVRGRGGDVRAGDTVVEAGARVGAAQLAALAAAGIAEIACTRRPRAAVVVTGSELRRPGEPLDAGEIYESNGVLLATLLADAGALAARAVVVTDDWGPHRRALEDAIESSDIVVTAGGASVGPHDLVRETLAELGTEEIFWGVAVKPGKPTGFRIAHGKPVLVLPGNPVSVLVTFELFVRPAVNALSGARDVLPSFDAGVLAASVPRNPRRHEFVRARIERRGAEVSLEPLPGQESHMIVRAGRADALVSVEAGDGGLAAGSRVLFLRLS